MRIQWEVDDGYVGKDRPHYLDVPDSELEDAATVEDALDVIREYVDEEFANTIHGHVSNEDAVRDQLRELLNVSA